MIKSTKEDKQPKVEIKPLVVSSLANENFKLIQDVATTERKQGGKMLNVSFNFFKMYEKNELHLKEFFTVQEQAKMKNFGKEQYLQAILTNPEINQKRQLTNAHFDKLANLVLINSLGKNRDEFHKNHKDEYDVLRQASPVILWWIENNKWIDYDKNKNPFTESNDQTPTRIKIQYDYFKQFGNEYDKNPYLKNFYLKTNMGVNYTGTFRGDVGMLELAKFSYKSTVEQNTAGDSKIENVATIFTDMTTKLKSNSNITKGDTGVAPQTRQKEINAIKLHIEESINMLVKSNTKESKKAIFDIYQVLAELMGTEEMNGYLKTICKNKSVKFEFNPLINNKPFNIEQGVSNIYKYISNI